MDDDRRDEIARAHRELRPLHAVPGDGSSRVTRKPGRPARARPAPSHDERIYIARVAELREAFVESDRVVRAVGRGDDALDDVLAAIGQEIASLRWERSRLPLTHPQAAIITSRVIHGLLKVAEIALVQAKVHHGHVDVGGTKFQAVVEAFLTDAKTAAEETLGSDTERFWSAFRSKLVGWEAKADEIVRGP